MSFRKPHIYRSLEPVRQEEVTAGDCGKTIQDPRFVMTIEGDISGKLDLSREYFCGKCVDAVEGSPKEARYIFGVVPSAWLAGKEETEC